MIECKINCCRCHKFGTCEHSQEILFKKLFYRFGSYQKEMSDKTIRLYEQHPENLHTKKDILHYFNRVSCDLEQLEECILELKAYQIALTQRYNYIETAPIKKKIKIKRDQRYREKVFYYILFYNVNLSDEYEELTNFVKYPGKERKQALLYFEQLKKENPDCIFECDIKCKY